MDFQDALNLGVVNDLAFECAGVLGYTLQNAAERIIALDEIRSFVSHSISKLEANEPPEDPAQDEEECLRKNAIVFFDPDTDEARRAQLEEFITDDDIAAELQQLKYQEKCWPDMIERDKARLKLINALKAKRAETVEGEAS